MINLKNEITFVIRPTEYGDHDILAIGDIKKLKELSKKESYYTLVKNSKFGGISILILDTCDKLSDAIKCIKYYRSNDKPKK